MRDGENKTGRFRPVSGLKMIDSKDVRFISKAFHTDRRVWTSSYSLFTLLKAAKFWANVITLFTVVIYECLL